MQVLVIFSALLAMASSYPLVKSWTISELPLAILDPKTDPAMKLFLAVALDVIASTFIGYKGDGRSGRVPITAIDISTWTESDLNEALNNPNTNRELITYLHKARAAFKEAQEKGVKRETIPLLTPVGLITHQAVYDYIPKANKRFFKKTITNFE